MDELKLPPIRHLAYFSSLLPRSTERGRIEALFVSLHTPLELGGYHVQRNVDELKRGWSQGGQGTKGRYHVQRNVDELKHALRRPGVHHDPGYHVQRNVDELKPHRLGDEHRTVSGQVTTFNGTWTN